MRICGLKLTHDSSITVLDDNRLLYCIELEKIKNNNRFSIISTLNQVEEILSGIGEPIDTFDQIAIDGWIGLADSKIVINDPSRPIELKVASYHESNLADDIMAKQVYSSLQIGKSAFNYSSYSHVAGHIASSYFTSPFFTRKQPSYILVWDGGMFPRLYFHNKKVQSLGPLFFLGANIYSIFSQHFGPFKINENVIKDELSVAGKVMAYVAFGKCNNQIIDDLMTVYNETVESAKSNAQISTYPYLFSKIFKVRYADKYVDEDIITSFHYFLQRLLIGNLKRLVGSSSFGNRNLCISGGAGLNIKWNSAIRESGIFDEVWIPPFPNDSGSSIGAALCCASDHYELDSFKWDLYNGMKLGQPQVKIDGWASQPMSLQQLARLLYETNEPVVFLNGRCELGPRALGNRSILASPVKPEMKDKLNAMKFREGYRPIAPVCLDEYANEIFTHGDADSFMVFEHTVRKNWLNKIPAIVHADETARLQTTNARLNPVLTELLTHFYNISGIPVLCNTSANFKGSGFFPDLDSAIRWGKTRYIWSEGRLYSKRAPVFAKSQNSRDEILTC